MTLSRNSENYCCAASTPARDREGSGLEFPSLQWGKHMLFCRPEPPFPSSVSSYINCTLHAADYHLSREMKSSWLGARCSALTYCFHATSMHPTPPWRCKFIDCLSNFPGPDLIPFLWNTMYVELSAEGVVDHPPSRWMHCRPCGLVHIHFSRISHLYIRPRYWTNSLSYKWIFRVCET